jgi:hypothetical protein
MPTEVRWFVRTSLLCLILSMIVGTAYFAWAPLTDEPPPGFVMPLHIHLGTVGWLVNMVMGVALWMFPMIPGSFAVGRARYSRPRVVAAYCLINGGLVLRFVAEPMGLLWLAAISGASQTAGVLLCVSCLWPRIRSVQPPTTPEARNIAPG